MAFKAKPQILFVHILNIEINENGLFCLRFKESDILKALTECSRCQIFVENF